MKKYILQTLVLVLILLLTLIALNYGLDKIITDKKYLSLPVSRPYVILGSSQAACAFNDSLLPSFVNLSTPMEGYFYTYFKTKMILKYNPHVKIVFLEYNNTQISSWSNNRVWGMYLPFLLPRYTSVIDWKGILFLLSKRPIKALQALHGSLLRKISFIAEGRKDLIKSELCEAIPFTRHFYTMDQIKAIQGNRPLVSTPHSDISETNLFYLEKINQLCNDHDIKLYLIRVPYPSYLTTDNEVVLKKLLATRFQHMEFLDFRNFPVSNVYYADLDPHLNSLGANKFSRFFNQLIEDGLLEEKDKEVVIRKAMALEMDSRF